MVFKVLQVSWTLQRVQPFLCYFLTYFMHHKRLPLKWRGKDSSCDHFRFVYACLCSECSHFSWYIRTKHDISAVINYDSIFIESPYIVIALKNCWQSSWKIFFQETPKFDPTLVSPPWFEKLDSASPKNVTWQLKHCLNFIWKALFAKFNDNMYPMSTEMFFYWISLI